MQGVAMRTRLLSVLSLLLLTAVTAAFATDFAVIVNPANPARAMALADLGKMFKGKAATWANGRNVTIVLREPSTPSMKFIIEKVMGVDAEQGKAILADPTRKSAAQVVFLGSDEEIVKTVETNPTAVGIVDVYSITGGVKVIKIDDKQPFDPGYALKGH
jgi:ABC-type phosphate transport system substrate-binding protein